MKMSFPKYNQHPSECFDYDDPDFQKFLMSALEQFYSDYIFNTKTATICDIPREYYYALYFLLDNLGYKFYEFQEPSNYTEQLEHTISVYL